MQTGRGGVICLENQGEAGDWESQSRARELNGARARDGAEELGNTSGKVEPGSRVGTLEEEGLRNGLEGGDSGGNCL